jgi:hypothetical protein
VNFHRYDGTSYEVVSVVRERVEAGRDSDEAREFIPRTMKTIDYRG